MTVTFVGSVNRLDRHCKQTVARRLGTGKGGDMKKRKMAFLLGVFAIIIASWAYVAIALQAPSVAPAIVTAERVNADPSRPEDPLWNSIGGQVIKTSGGPREGGHGGVSATPEIKMKAAYNGDYLYTYFEWDDATEDKLHSYWSFNNGTWSMSSANVNEDRLYLMWPIVDGPGREGKTFAQGGCAVTCHKIASKKMVDTPEEIGSCGACHLNSGQPNGFQHEFVPPTISCNACHTGYVDRSAFTEADHAAQPDLAYDIWHWKAGRGANIGFADDQVVASGNSRSNDGSPGLDSDNKQLKEGSTSTYIPKYIWALNESNSESTGDFNRVVKKSEQPSLVEISSDGLVIKDTATPIPDGTTVRAKILNDVDAAASNKHIQSAHTWSSGKYRVVLKRKLDTGDPKDYKFNLTGDNYFSIAVTNNSAIKHSGNAGPNILRFASWGPSITSPSHPNQGVWYREATATISWASIEAEIGGIDCVVDKSPTTVPSGDPRPTTSPIIIGIPSDGIWYLHLRLQDTSGNWSSAGHYRLNIDRTPPSSGKIVINGGSSTTGTLIVKLELASSDALSGVAKMRLSNDGVTWSPEEAFSSYKTWDLSKYGGNANQGIKRVYAQFKDAAGNWSPTYSAEIRLVNSITDATADGRSDALALYDYGGSTSALWAFNSVPSTANSIGLTFSPTAWWKSAPGGFDANKTKAVTGDFDGDDKADVIALYDYGEAISRLWFFRSTGSSFASPVSVFYSTQWDFSRTKLVSGDFNGDGKDELLAFYNYGGTSTGVFVIEWSPNGAFKNPRQLFFSRHWDWTKTRLLSVKQGSKSRVVAAYNYGGSKTGLWTFEFDANNNLKYPALSFVSEHWDFNRTSFLTGDLNADGNVDIIAFYDYGGTTSGAFAFKATALSGDKAFAYPERYFLSAQWAYSRSTFVPGDFNGDGKADAGAVYDYGGGKTGIWLFKSSGSALSYPVMAYQTPYWNSGATRWIMPY